MLLLWLWAGAETVSGARYKVVTPKKGDGINRLLQRHGLSPEQYLQPFIELNKASLGPDNSLRLGQQYKLPLTQGYIVEPLFGKQYERVRPKDQRLDGGVFYLVSGHGGPDPGGIGRDGKYRLYEDEYAYDVTLRLGRRLLEHGAEVYFIIRDENAGIRDSRYLGSDKDEVCYPNQKIPLNQVARLRQRVAAVNSLYRKDPGARYKRCLVVHVDARRQREKIDIFFYHHARSRGGKRLAEVLRDTVEEKYRLNQPDRGYAGTVSSRNLYMLTQTDPPTVYIELGNIHNPRDQERLIEPNNRQALANWLCEGVLKDFRNSVP